MIDMHSKFDNMHKNEMFYALLCINSHVITSINYVLSRIQEEVLHIIFEHIVLPFGGKKCDLFYLTL